jgi:aryl-alcohol dehydrogenase-like predicted oxidoreductase
VLRPRAIDGGLVSVTFAVRGARQRRRAGTLRAGGKTRVSASGLASCRSSAVNASVERLLPLAADAGLRMTHMAMAFAITHPNVTSALIGPRTAERLDDLLAGLDVRLTDELLDRIDEIVPPGTDVGTLDQAFVPAALQHAALRRRPLAERAAV